MLQTSIVVRRSDFSTKRPTQVWILYCLCSTSRAIAHVGHGTKPINTQINTSGINKVQSHTLRTIIILNMTHAQQHACTQAYIDYSITLLFMLDYIQDAWLIIDELGNSILWESLSDMHDSHIPLCCSMIWFKHDEWKKKLYILTDSCHAALGWWHILRKVVRTVILETKGKF